MDLSEAYNYESVTGLVLYGSQVPVQPVPVLHLLLMSRPLLLWDWAGLENVAMEHFRAR